MKNKNKTERKMQFFSEDTQRLYQLYGSPATLKISGVPMHRHVSMTPLEHAKKIVDSLSPSGTVLDTTTGLGYTAIISAARKEVERVLTVEKDPNVLAIAKHNPDSDELFDSKKIEIMDADSSQIISTFKDEQFDYIIHDPPTFSISPDLYTLKFHIQLFRVLKNGGKLWHYAPEPRKLKGQGPRLKERIMRQLREAGFKNVTYDSDSTGITAEK